LSLDRIVQEAINNAVRHAEARMIRVVLGGDQGRARVVIEDDGHGLAQTPGRRSGGLSNMFTRASLIGADLKASAPESGKGTRLELILPVAEFEPLNEHAGAEA